MADLCALLDEVIRRLDAHAAAHPEREGTVLEAQQIVCEAMLAHIDAAERARLAVTLLGRGIRGTP